MTFGGAKWHKVGHRDTPVEQQNTFADLSGRLDNAFVGLYAHSLDAKRRFTIPSDWRDAVAGEPLYVLPGFNTPCLHVFTARDMSQRLKTARTVSISNVRAQQLQRMLFSRSCRVTLDAQGRIRVTDALLDEAGVKNQIILVGVANRFELWSPEKWQEQSTLLEQQSYEDVASSLGL